MNAVERFYNVLVHPKQLARFEDDTVSDVVGQLLFNVLLSVFIPLALLQTRYFSSLNNEIAEIVGEYFSLVGAQVFVIGVGVGVFLLLMISNFVFITLLESVRDSARPFEVFKILVYASIPVTVSRSIPQSPTLFVFALTGYSAYLTYQGLRQIEHLSHHDALYVFIGAQFLQILSFFVLLISAALLF